jgi:HPt (histidine-containing phosphotransfer) domain-containing protein
MSDEFLKVATAEINDEISEIQHILNSCHDDLDVYANAVKIQKSTHKIKGLAPMMGKDDLGNLSSLLDSVLKKIMDGAIVDNLFDSMKDSVDEMKNSMTYSDYNLDVIKQRIIQISSDLS